MPAKHTFTASFLHQTMTRKSARIYSHAWLVEFIRDTGERDDVGGFSGSAELARKEADAWVRRLKGFEIQSVEIAETTVGR